MRHGGVYEIWGASKKRNAVAHNHPVLILITGSFAVGFTITPAEANTFEHTRLKDVVQSNVSFPFFLITTGCCLDIVAGKVHDRCFQTRNAQSGEVVGILTESCILTCTGEALDKAIGI